MSTGDVTSKPEAIEAIDKMKTTINGGLLDSITTLITNGDLLNPEKIGRAHV